MSAKSVLDNQKKNELKVHCPKCKDEFHYYESEFRPFCSKKCQLIDLGKWFDEEYTC